MLATQLSQQSQIPQNFQYVQNPQMSYYQPQNLPVQKQVINYNPQTNDRIQNKNIYSVDSNQDKSYPFNMRQTDFLIYCPVCKVDYFNSQVNSHMRRHYAGNQFKSKLQEKDLSQTAQTVVSYNQVISYPLVQPLQFYTNELDEVARGDRYKFIINQNFGDFENDVQPQQRHQINVQTSAKPPLQYASDKTNFYNCLDNVVNDDNFTLADVIKNNEGLASKRELTSWEYLVLGSKK